MVLLRNCVILEKIADDWIWIADPLTYEAITVPAVPLSKCL